MTDHSTDVDGQPFKAYALYLDRHGDTWRFVSGDFVHVKRANQDALTTGPSVLRHIEDAAAVARDFGPMTKVETVRRRIDGPIPFFLGATPSGAKLDVSKFVGAMLLNLFDAADSDPEGFGEEFADMHAMAQAAQRCGADSHERHAFDERLNQMIDTYADGGTVEVYDAGLRQLLSAVQEIAAPRPVPGQRGAA